ncbi:MAG: 1-deoxy-D-xylulose-5-phosphate reductoisomerase [Halothermotrichaceae bacterium]
MKKLVLLGSTGSIGTQTLEVIDHLDETWKIVGLTANSNIDLLEKQAVKYQPEYLVIMYEHLAKELEYRLDNHDIKILSGKKGLEYLAGQVEAELVINALVGAVGLKPTMAALKSGKKLGLANKESLVIGGEVIQKYIKENKNKILPIDSEHNAVFQIMKGHDKSEVEKIILTASGGPFREYPEEKLNNVSVKQALDHPNWDMGGKITIDSATLINKGLEVIEAHWLFQQPYDNIKVVVHPESIIHSMVEFVDGSIMAELGVADMKIPIQYIFTYPDRHSGKSKKLDLYKTAQLNFEKPDFKKFPGLELAYTAGKEGGTLPVVFNGANEIAVNNFLENRISFTYIPIIIEKVMNKHNIIYNPVLDDIYQVDEWSRRMAKEALNSVNSD